jgi:hypothetical protein
MKKPPGCCGVCWNDGQGSGLAMSAANPDNMNAGSIDPAFYETGLTIMKITKAGSVRRFCHG